MRENNITQAWKLYEEGREYNNRLVPNQYNVVNTNTEFFIGNQWINLPETPAMRGLPKPTFNILSYDKMRRTESIDKKPEHQENRATLELIDL